MSPGSHELAGNMKGRIAATAVAWSTGKIMPLAVYGRALKPPYDSTRDFSARKWIDAAAASPRRLGRRAAAERGRRWRHRCRTAGVNVAEPGKARL